MNYIFEVIDKTGRKIRLVGYAWKHITRKHPMMSDYIEEMQQALKRPTAITISLADDSIHYYYFYIKNKPGTNKYLFLSVKYLNGEGFVLSSYFEDKIT